MKKSYKIEVDCANCANKMEEAAKNTAGVKDASVNFMMLKMKVEFEEGQVKLLKSACANAENNFSMDPDKLVVTQVFATPGPILKRMMPRAQGRAYRINKRTSHVTLAVAERD